MPCGPGATYKTNQLDATLCEFGLEFGECTQLSGAYWGVILWVREENDPLVADELVEVNVAIGGLSLEVGGFRAETERSGRHGCVYRGCGW